MNQELDITGAMDIARASGLFASLATFRKPSGTFDAGGAPTGAYSDVSGLVDVPCMKAAGGGPPAVHVAAEQERRQPEITSMDQWHVLLNGLYPTVESGWRGENAGTTGPWRVVVDGTVYQIDGVDRDSQGQMTRVEARLTTI